MIHTRNLIEFLLEGKGGLIHRTDFLDAPWNPPKSDAKRRLLAAREPINQYVTHLGVDRARPSEGAWDYPDVGDDLIFVMAQFVERLEMVHPERTLAFEQALRSARSHLAGAGP